MATQYTCSIQLYFCILLYMYVYIYSHLTRHHFRFVAFCYTSLLPGNHLSKYHLKFPLMFRTETQRIRIIPIV
uniref:Putative secreted peptide n=1 Tax=Anopheles braziliensis TaxID=58242 RepID=A0A2M3ZWD4_9DIPT